MPKYFSGLVKSHKDGPHGSSSNARQAVMSQIEKMTANTKKTDQLPKKVLLLGSGGLSIGQVILILKFELQV